MTLPASTSDGSERDGHPSAGVSSRTGRPLSGTDPASDADLSRRAADALRRLHATREDVPGENALIGALGAVEAARDIVSGLPPDIRVDLDRGRSADPPDEADLERAVRTLFDHLASTRGARRDRLVALLRDAPSLDEDRLYQAYRRADDQRRLMASVETLGTQDLVALMPDRLSPDSNLSRTLERLRGRGALLGLRIRGNWRYPADQFDARGRVIEPLPDTLRRAFARGYDEWEILHWLATPRTPVGAAIEPGRPIEGLGADASLDEIVSRALVDDEAPPDPPLRSPFEWLARGELDQFRIAAGRWLD